MNKKFSSAGITLKLDGFEDVIKIFETLDEKMKKKALRPALRDGAKVIQKDAKRRAHKRSGANRKNIKVRAMKRSRTQFGYMVRTGTRKELGIPEDEEYYYPAVEEYGGVNHNAHPYMRPALHTQKDLSIG